MKSSSQPSSSSAMLRKNEPLAQQAARSILGEIRAGVFKPGDKLPSESKLAETYGISRTIIREALASMKNDNILESRQGRGIIVKDPHSRQAFRFSDVFTTISQAEVHYLYEMRATLEAEAACFAAMRQTDEDTAMIKKGIDALAQAVKEHTSGDEAHDMFNEAIAQASHNPLLIEFLCFLRATLRSLARELRLNTMMSPERAALVLREHEKIAEAILARNAQEARNAVLDHLCHAAQRAGFAIYTP